MDLLTGVLPAVTLAIGIVGTLLTEWIRDRLQRGRETAERDVARQRSLDDRRDQFEIETVRQTYDALTSLARATLVYHLLDLKVAREHSVLYGSRQIAGMPGVDEADQETLLANRALDAVARLVLDDEARDLTLQASTALNAIAFGPKTVEQAEHDLNVATHAVDAAHQALASRIRALYLARE